MVEFVSHAPTAQQQQGIDWLCARVEDGEPVSALTGYAGTGKTTVIPHLRTRCVEMGLPVTLAAPTHRAAAVLRSKGLANVETVHRACTVPYFTPPYVAALQWFGEESAVLGSGDLYALAEEYDDEGIPRLVRSALAPLRSSRTPQMLKAQAPPFTAEDMLASIGIDGGNYIDHYGPRPEQGGVLIIDEASMVDQEMLSIACEVFETIVLVGDPGQLPPVEGTPALGDVDHFMLREIHRQAQDSPIIQLAYAARDGLQYWRWPLTAYQPAVAVRERYPALDALTGPVIVWTNDARLECTTRIWTALGYAPDRPVVGEPLICRARGDRARLRGFYNNAAFRVMAVAGDEGRDIMVQDELDGAVREATVHLEELDGPAMEPGRLRFRFGYVFTAWTAQGGEWPQIALSLSQARRHNGACFHRGKLQESIGFGYTAITRAKERLILLTDHLFI